MHFDVVLPYIGAVITKYHTDSDPSSSQRPQAADSEASLRAELAERISGAQAEIEHHLTELRRAASAGGDATPLLQADAQREGLGRLLHRIAQAHGAGLVSIRAEVSAFVAAAQAVAQQARTVAATAQAAEVALHAASAAARQEITSFVHDFYEKKIFDPYLRFASVEDEEAYRKREAERREAIDKALAEGTPEGNLRANQLAIDQLKDAGAHGADQSPDYQPSIDRLEASGGVLETQIAAANGSERAGIVAKRGSRLAAAEGPVEEKPCDVALAADLLASLRESGMTTSDDNQSGHGVTLAEPPKGKAPVLPG